MFGRVGCESLLFKSQTDILGVIMCGCVNVKEYPEITDVTPAYNYFNVCREEKLQPAKKAQTKSRKKSSVLNESKDNDKEQAGSLNNAAEAKETINRNDEIESTYNKLQTLLEKAGRVDELKRLKYVRATDTGKSLQDDKPGKEETPVTTQPNDLQNTALKMQLNDSTWLICSRWLNGLDFIFLKSWLNGLRLPALKYRLNDLRLKNLGLQPNDRQMVSDVGRKERSRTTSIKKDNHLFLSIVINHYPRGSPE